MRNIGCILLFPFFLLSCQLRNNNELEEFVKEEKLTKLEQLLLLPHDSVMEHYDLSNDSILSFPDLSTFTIKSLDLSYNLLDTIKPSFLPEGLAKLNLSHNLYCGFILIKEKEIPFLKELDMSHNALNRIDVAAPLYRVIVSYNDLNFIDINHKNIQYLDISYNSGISERVSFEPLWIDTIVRNGVAEGKCLLGPMTGFVIE